MPSVGGQFAVAFWIVVWAAVIAPVTACRRPLPCRPAGADVEDVGGDLDLAAA